jgi:hypothetical protein
MSPAPRYPRTEAKPKETRPLPARYAAPPLRACPKAKSEQRKKKRGVQP